MDAYQGLVGATWLLFPVTTIPVKDEAIRAHDPDIGRDTMGLYRCTLRNRTAPSSVTVEAVEVTTAR
jgi:hypothetical protein